MGKKTASFCPLLLGTIISLCSLTAQAGGPVVWEIDSRAELLRGEARGVSISDTGALMLAPRFTQLFDTGQTYVWSSAVDASGNVYLGTGHDGKIFRVTGEGRGTLFYDAPELDVTALVIGRDGALYAGTSPNGKVYRITMDGRAEVYFDPPDKYIWALAVLPDGALAVGTGDQGKIYRVRSAGAKPEESLLADVNEMNVVSLAVDARGDLLVGTDPNGLVLRIGPDGRIFALFDSPLREIHALAPAADGSVYALALGDTTSTSRATQAATQTQSSASAQTSVSVTVVEDMGGAPVAQPTPARSRNDLGNARSAVFRLLPDGGNDILWSSNTVVAFSIVPAPQGGRVLIGTGDKGRIYSVTNDGRDTLLVQSTEDQISTLVARGEEVYAASSNQGKLFRLTPEIVGEGSYESPVRDAKFVASWGRIWWRGSGDVEIQTRTGNTERPDKTWSEWSAPYRDPSGTQITSPRARFIQWRAVLHIGKAHEMARVEEVKLAYLPRNVAPEVTSITVLPIGVGLQPAIQPQVDPNIEASGLDPSLFGAPTQTMPRRIYQRGAVSLQWQAEDRNGDTLEYAIYYRALNESTFHLLKDRVRDNFYTVDGTKLADGRYIFKIVATDEPDNPPGLALTGEKVTEPVTIDNTPPNIRAAAPEVLGDRARVRFTVEDQTGIIRRADVSVDGGDWKMVFPDDGIADSPREVYTIEIDLNAGRVERTIAIRVYDDSGNAGSGRVVIRR
ncbi:ligand-binding sensor domain-containing protein [Pyrinomonas methylaliphatogenes]|uniref:Fibronectin type-III domain-containing protein n=1 Tax=Pyrinomonas methylaliphatogenes TaxID=454194 RepID=A0A0B6WVV9_9BACT|nr:hypothetical protein [Pyrinomonas methylaliphatogenes]CDM64275.1 hypothetical protein PYK22_00268 [Pyrinomonas methylaliphatogenes]